MRIESYKRERERAGKKRNKLFFSDLRWSFFFCKLTGKTKSNVISTHTIQTCKSFTLSLSIMTTTKVCNVISYTWCNPLSLTHYIPMLAGYVDISRERALHCFLSFFLPTFLPSLTMEGKRSSALRRSFTYTICFTNLWGCHFIRKKWKVFVGVVTMDDDFVVVNITQVLVVW